MRQLSIGHVLIEKCHLVGILVNSHDFYQGLSKQVSGPYLVDIHVRKG